MIILFNTRSAFGAGFRWLHNQPKLTVWHQIPVSRENKKTGKQKQTMKKVARRLSLVYYQENKRKISPKYTYCRLHDLPAHTAGVPWSIHTLVHAGGYPSGTPGAPEGREGGELLPLRRSPSDARTELRRCVREEPRVEGCLAWR